MEIRPVLRRFVLVAGVGIMAWPAAADFASDLSSLHDKAAASRAGGDLAAVEQLRRERRGLLVSADKGSPWANGISVSRAVAGEGQDAGSPRPHDPLDHRAALRLLRDAWKPFAEQSKGPVFGDLATQMFALAQRALAEHPEALTEGSPHQVATVAELREALTISRDRDPCQAGIAPMIAFLDAPASEEAFLRLEVRPVMKKRLDMLRQSTRKPGDPLLPWHAAAELVRARELADILRDGERVRPLTHSLAGFDGRSSPFRLIGGRLFLIDLSGPGEPPKPAFVRPDGAGGWLGKTVTVLWQYPTGGATAPPGSAAAILGGLRPERSLELGTRKFGFFLPTVPDVHRLIEAGGRRLAVNNLGKLWKTSFNVSGNDPKLLEALVDDKAVPPTDPDVAARIETFARTRDKLTHALADLCSTFNPLIIVADQKGLPMAPRFLPSADGLKRLMLDDGRTLTVVETPAEECSLSLEDDGVTLHAPLRVDAIPRQLLLATEAGKVADGILQQAGYDEAGALAELRSGIDNPGDVPQRVSTMLKNLAKKQRRDIASVGQWMLSERNWNSPISPMADLADRYDRLGFRYLSVGRSRLVTRAELFSPPGSGPVSIPQPPASPSATQPFDERALSIRSLATAEPIDPFDVGTAEMHQTIRTRVATSLANVLAWHPSLAALDAVRSMRAPSTGPTQPGSKAGPFPEWIAADAGDRGMLDQLLEGLSAMAAAAQDDRTARLGLRAIHLHSIRDLAKNRRIHEAMVGYRELLEHFDRADHGFQRRPAPAVDRQPTADEIKRFGEDIAMRLEDTLVGAIAEAEQGAVLRAAGHEASAGWLWRRCIDRHRLCLLPLLDRSIAELDQFEETVPEAMTTARARIVSVLDEIEFEAGKPAAASTHADDAISPPTDGSRELFTAWLGRKLTARAVTPRDLWQGGSSPISPLQLAPAVYSKDKGFRVDLATLLPDSPPDSMALSKNEGSPSGPSGQRPDVDPFLLGWYWLECGDGPRAREAFSAAARHAFVAEADATATLVSRRNRLMLLMAAESAQGTPAGAPWTGTFFLDAIMAEAAAWQRDWSRAGQNATHASGEVATLEAFADLLRRCSSRRRDAVGGRFFTADTSFECGPLPDRLVADARQWKVFQSVPRDPDLRPKPVQPAPPQADPNAPPPPPAPGDEPRPLDFPAFLKAVYKLPVAPDQQVMTLQPRSPAD